MKNNSQKQKILIVDDAPVNIRVLAENLMPFYEISVAIDGNEALEIASTAPFPDLILLDIVMPEIDGYEVCRRLKANPRTKKIPIIFITSRSDEEDETKGLELDAVDYITKPFCISIVKARIRTHLDLKRHQDHLDELVTEKTNDLIKAYEEVQKTTAKLKIMIEQTVNALRSSVEMKDPYTSGHQARVTQLACAIGENMNLTAEQIEGIRFAGLLHDIGKIAIPAEILSKPGILSENEFRLLKEHSAIGYEILKGIDFPRPVAEIVLQHHEKLSGTGYPHGLKGDQILPDSRILTVADVVEAMSTHRPYRPALGIDRALDEITKNKGIFYDEQVVENCVVLFKQKKFAFIQS